MSAAVATLSEAERGRRVGRRLAWCLGLPVLLFLVAPVIAVIPMSFSASQILELIPSQFSLVQYERFFSSHEWMDALYNSVVVAAGATVVATILGVMAAIALWRLPERPRQLAEAVLILPRIVPSIVFAVAVYNVFLTAGAVGSIGALILAHGVLALPFVVVFVGSALRSFDRTQDEASRGLGAGHFTTFRRVILPQIRLSILGSALFAFSISFDEVVVTLFISGIRSKTLPVKIWDAIQHEIVPILPAISALVVLLTIAALLPLFILFRRKT